MGRTGGGEPSHREHAQWLWEQGLHMAPEGSFRSASVEIDGADLRMGREKGAEVVGNDGGLHDVRIEASRSFAAGEDVPEGDASPTECLAALDVGRAGIKTEQSSENWPEGVARMAVILALRQGCLAGHAAQDKTGRIASGDGRKAPKKFHFRKAP